MDIIIVHIIFNRNKHLYNKKNLLQHDIKEELAQPVLDWAWPNKLLNWINYDMGRIGNKL